MGAGAHHGALTVWITARVSFRITSAATGRGASTVTTTTTITIVGVALSGLARGGGLVEEDVLGGRGQTGAHLLDLLHERQE